MLTKKVGRIHWQIEEHQLILAGEKTIALSEKKRQEQLDILTYQKDQLLLADVFDLAEVRRLTAEINVLKNK